MDAWDDRLGFYVMRYKENDMKKQTCNVRGYVKKCILLFDGITELLCCAKI